MRRKMFTVWSRMAVLLLLAVSVPAHAATSCAAGSPNTTSVLESTPTADFNINGNGTVTHTKTGLMWKQCAEGLSGAACATGSATPATWGSALKAADIANLAVFAGFTDWRLPNKKELESIVEFCGFNPAINQTAFPGGPSSGFWSGTSYVPNPAIAWLINFVNGDTNGYFKSVSSNVRLVRGGQSLGSFDLLGPYGVTYNGNGNNGGSVPTDGTAYVSGATVTVLGNSGSLVKTGATFAGWNTAANGSGTSYAGGATFAMGTGNVTLYAQWTPIPTYSVSYNGNGSTGGAVPVDGTAYATAGTVTVLGNIGALVKLGSTFAGWNTAANGSGTGYAGGATFAMSSGNVTLFAQWTPIPTYTVTYNGNGSTGGVAPVDGTAYATGATATVLGNTGALVKSGSTFAGWNTAANGSGAGYAGGATFVIGSGNVTLYAQWTPVAATYSVSYNGNGNTGGSVPTDGNAYALGAAVIVRANTGSLARTGFTLVGWNALADGTGTSYPATGTATFTMGSGNVTLYALWGSPGCTLDVDGNGVVDALTDGLLTLRAQFGLTGTAVTNGAIGSGATRTTWAQIRTYLNANCGTNFSP